MYQIYAFGVVSTSIESDFASIIEELAYYTCSNKADMMGRIDTEAVLRTRADGIAALAFNHQVLDASWGTLGQAIQGLTQRLEDAAAYEANVAMSEYDEKYSERGAWVQAKNLHQEAWNLSTEEEFMAGAPIMEKMFGKIMVRAFINATKATNGGFENAHQIPRVSVIATQCEKLLARQKNMVTDNRADRAVRR